MNIYKFIIYISFIYLIFIISESDEESDENDEPYLHPSLASSMTKIEAVG